MRDIGKSDLKILDMMREERIRTDWWNDPRDYKYKEQLQRAKETGTEKAFFTYDIPRAKEQFEEAEQGAQEALIRIAKRIWAYEKKSLPIAESLGFQMTPGKPQIDMTWKTIKQSIKIEDVATKKTNTVLDIVWEPHPKSLVVRDRHTMQAFDSDDVKNLPFFYLALLLWYREGLSRAPVIISARKQYLLEYTARTAGTERQAAHKDARKVAYVILKWMGVEDDEWDGWYAEWQDAEHDIVGHSELTYGGINLSNYILKDRPKVIRILKSAFPQAKIIQRG